uniref:N-acetyltransferase domain-containing protein n=1 Tax=Fibrocapsa japonica TaxID=94617 RepID=A0A7S2USK3_9STRA|mmetsp:Transcript_11235/g.16553  ORF Transcript_11235/g.16553 Transcript_11235/m.16553 type:complete len:181 (+) Transcript_11235:53-595(+)
MEENRKLKVEFGAITEKNVMQLRRLNHIIFPVKYHDKFYTDILNTPEEFTTFAYWNGFVVGAVCSRFEASSNGRRNVYIMTLGVLAAYRGRSIGSQLLERVLSACEAYDDLDHIYLHVQTSNTEALNFYRCFGFEQTDIIRNYYKRIEPPDCYILKKRLSGSQEDAQNTEEVVIELVAES